MQAHSGKVVPDQTSSDTFVFPRRHYQRLNRIIPIAMRRLGQPAPQANTAMRTLENASVFTLPP